MKVLVDETLYSFDRTHSCFIVMQILASEAAIESFRKWHLETFMPDTLRFKNKTKVHYTDEDSATKQVLVEYVKNLEVTAKVFIWRDNNHYNKANVIEWSLAYQLQSQPDSVFFIEESSNEYDRLSSETVHITNNVNHPEIAIADIFAGVYLARTFTKPYDEAAERLYQFLRPRLRLEVEREFDGNIKKRTRSEILR